MSDRVNAVARATALAAAFTLGIGCAGSDGEGETAGETPEEPRRELFRVPTENMEPALRFRQVVTIASEVERFQPGDICHERPARHCLRQPTLGAHQGGVGQRDGRRDP
jgi:hypothetical protein